MGAAASVDGTEDDVDKTAHDRPLQITRIVEHFMREQINSLSIKGEFHPFRNTNDSARGQPRQNVAKI